MTGTEIPKPGPACDELARDELARDALDCLLAPRRLAIVGVSTDFNRLNGRVMKFLLEKGYGGDILPVNPKYRTVGGRPCFADLADVPGEIDLVVVAVPAAQVAGELDKAGRRGVPAAVVFSSGFGEMGEAGARLEREAVAVARRHGLRLCGPNTLGLINAFENVYATFTQYGMGETAAGPVGFVTQSGAFGTAIAALARRRGLGLGYFVNTGNEADVTFAEVAGRILADPRITVLAGYVEGLRDGPGFLDVARQALEAGKPMVVAKVGRTRAGERAASSHTGSLAGAAAVYDGLADQFGICRARNEEQMLDLVEAFAATPVPAGRRIAIVTQSGGAGVLMSDRAEDLGLQLATLAPQTIDRLRAVLPVFAATGNPVDVTAQFIADPTILKDSVTAVMEDPGVDAVVVWLQLMDGFVAPLVETFRQICETATKPLVVSWVAAPEAGLQGLRDLGLCVLRGGEPAIEAIAALCRWGEARERWQADAPARAACMLPAPALPPGARSDGTGAGGTGAGGTGAGGAGAGGAGAGGQEMPGQPGRQVGALEAAAALSAAGIALARIRLAADPAEAVAAAEALGYPVALKIESPDIAHKTEIGGVEIGLADAAATRAAAIRILARAQDKAPAARLDGLLVQEMRQGTVDLVVGLREDPVFGMVVMAGLGGIFVEVLQDVVFRRAPVTEAEALEMLERLRGAPLLRGVRGKPGADRALLAAFIARVSEFGAANAGRLAELDLNPVLAGPDGAVAVDWLMVAR